MCASVVCYSSGNQIIRYVSLSIRVLNTKSPYSNDAGGMRHRVDYNIILFLISVVDSSERQNRKTQQHGRCLAGVRSGDGRLRRRSAREEKQIPARARGNAQCRKRKWTRRADAICLTNRRVRLPRQLQNYSLL